MLSPENENKTRPLSRRQALKALAATAGVATLSNLPDKWQAPVIEGGLLPALAQTSNAFSISDLSSVFTSLNDCPFASVTGSTRTESFAFNDPSGQVTTSAIVNFAYRFLPDGVSDAVTIPIGGPWPDFVINVTQAGGTFNGIITLILCARFGTETALRDTISLTNAAGHTSNSLTITITKPAGAQSTEGEPLP